MTMMQKVFNGALVVGLCWLAYYMHHYLAEHGLATLTDEGKWRLDSTSTGWKMLADALPLTLLGVMVGAGISIPLIAFCYKTADRQAHQYEIEQLKQAVDERRQHIEREFEERRAAIEELREQSYTRIHQADARLKLAKEYDHAVRLREDALDATLAVAYAERDQARQEARNTKFSYQRKVKHAEDLQARLDGIEL
ncbi:hypothetical protein [Aeromonas caviae]|uniref:hypothetical protein n=1 Tax=Aeromonas caviae TaxID=648 RepID=UPI00101B1191|nr:hypothetical protein [Aeromonas caviae]BBG91776.1 hypothetical protein ACGSH8M1_p30050 [Aeromonas caviae]BBT55394.1 hypothetical protein WP8S18C01_P30110 [Aeromonas caviae]